MGDVHPNLALLQRLDLRDPTRSADLISKDFVWHYFNPNLPDMEGDYAGVDGLKVFFNELGRKSRGTFEISPISATPMGDEFVVVHVRDTLTLDEDPIAVDAVVVWRFVDGRIAEAWDIPAAHSLAMAEGAAQT